MVILAGLVILDILYFAGAFTVVDPLWKEYRIVRYKLNDKNYRFLVADTTAKRMKGLMNVRELKGADGMIFFFDSKSPQSFWNQNTYVDLDVYWISDDAVIGYEHLPSIEKKGLVVISSPKPVDTVIEFVRKK